MDLFPTALAVAGVKLPADRPFDGVDLAPLLFKGTDLKERPFFYYRGTQLFACRLGNHKAHFFTQAGYSAERAQQHEPPLLYDLAVDPGEQFNIAAENPEVLKAISAAVADHHAELKPGALKLE